MSWEPSLRENGYVRDGESESGILNTEKEENNEQPRLYYRNRVECSDDRIRRAANATLDSCDVMFIRITRFKAQLALFMKSSLLALAATVELLLSGEGPPA